MVRSVTATTAFYRSAKRLSEGNSLVKEAIARTLRLLAADAFDPQLKTHKLKGRFAGTWSVSAGYDLRIVFEFAKRDTEIVLLRVGSHDDVY